MADLPIYLVDEQDSNTILSRMKDEIPTDLDSTEGSFIHDALAPAAIELATAARWAQQVLRRGFASTTYGSYLDLRVEEHGLKRLAATRATGTVTFTGTSGTTIPADTRVSTTSSSTTAAVVFTTDAAATIGSAGSVDVAIMAVSGGTAGNVAAGTITRLSSPISGVAAVANASATSGGTATESDAKLLARYLQRVQNPSSSGNRADYEAWALECSDVGGVSVIPLDGGAGKVTVAIIGSDKKPASSGVVAAVQQYIDPGLGTGEGKAPIGAAVTVVAATAVTISVSASLTIAEGYTTDTVKAAVTSAIESYIQGLAFANDNDVRYVRIGNMILDTPGVTDYANLLVNGGTANIVIAAHAVAVLGSVTLT